MHLFLYAFRGNFSRAKFLRLVRSANPLMHTPFQCPFLRVSRRKGSERNKAAEVRSSFVAPCDAHRIYAQVNCMIRISLTLHCALRGAHQEMIFLSCTAKAHSEDPAQRLRLPRTDLPNQKVISAGVTCDPRPARNCPLNRTASVRHQGFKKREGGATSFLGL